MEKLFKRCFFGLPVLCLLVGMCGGAWSEWWMPGSLAKMQASGEIDQFWLQQWKICFWAGFPFVMFHALLGAGVSVYLMFVNFLGVLGLIIGASLLQ